MAGNIQGDTLSKSASRGDISTVQEFLLDPAVLEQINQTNEGGYTPLQAAIPGVPDVVRILLEHGANPNVRDPSTGNDKMERTPLHNILHHDDEIIAILLIQHGADVTIQDARGDTPLHLAARKSSIRVLSEMDGTGQLQPQHYQTRNGEGKSPLDIALERQSSDRQTIIDFIQAHAQSAPAP